ncbi:hypothetical protein A4A49_54217 [Nicotiana attenuata]|uniref:RNase H type-1 domain-containing protein n=1 Tax=Nicotiana attenuata TaxID=49451 RepID=A0A1J6KFQ5_NICAT|nr:hypothetical protein A4A49_54217 [Nicotiana attenuata]
MEYKLLTTNQKRPPIIRETILIKWNPPEPNTYKLNMDGSCLENPGKGGIGGIIRRGNGECVLGEQLPPLTIETDCKELINLIDNKNCSYNLISDCRCLLIRARDPPPHHVCREANQAADSMAKNGSSLPVLGSLMTYLIPPTFVISILERDKLGTTCPRTIPVCNELCNDS